MSRKPNPPEGLGKAIRQARNSRGWSQDELAERARVSRPTVARIETGSAVSTDTLAKIVEALGLSIQLQAPGS